MYVSILVSYDSTQEDFYKRLHPEMENLLHQVYTLSIQAPFISNIGWLFHSHKHTNLPCLANSLEGILCCLKLNGPTITLGFQFKNIWDGYKTPQGLHPCCQWPFHYGPSLCPTQAPNCLRLSMWKLQGSMRVLQST